MRPCIINDKTVFYKSFVQNKFTKINRQNVADVQQGQIKIALPPVFDDRKCVIHFPIRGTGDKSQLHSPGQLKANKSTSSVQRQTCFEMNLIVF